MIPQGLSISTNNQKSDKIILLIILFTTFLPSYGKFGIIKIILIFVLWSFKTAQGIVDERIMSYRKKSRGIILLWFISIFLAAFAVFIMEGAVNYSRIVHELSRLFYYIFLIDLSFKISISLKFLFYACSVIIIIHLGIQWAQSRSIAFVDDFIMNNYLGGDEISVSHYLDAKYNSEVAGIMARTGSIFVNPNVYVCYPYLSLGVFLEYFRRNKGNFPLFMIIAAFVSVIYTGSRMGMGSFLLILIWYLWYSKKFKSNIPAGALSIKWFLIIIALIFFVILYFQNIIDWINNTRAFSLDKAYESSGEIKLYGLLGYLKISYPLEWLFGSLGSDRLNIPIDMEWGYIYAWFGILGLIWYLKLIKLIYDYHKKQYRIISTVSALAVILTAIGASSVLNMSVFPFICAIAFTNLSPLHRNHKLRS